MDLVEDRECQHLADAWDRAQQLEGLRIVLLGLPHEVALEVGQQRVVAIEQGEIDGDGLAHDAVLEVIGDAFAIARVGDPLGEGREVVLLVGHWMWASSWPRLRTRCRRRRSRSRVARMPAGYT